MDTIIISEEENNVISINEDNHYIIDEEPFSSIITDGYNIIEVSENGASIILALEQGPEGIQGPSGGEEEVKLDLLIEEVNSEGDLYVGEATPGSSTASAVWRIYFFDVTGSLVEKRYADGTADFTKVWDDRLSYSY